MSGPASEFVTELVQAGAGAGKTHDLLNKIERMVCSYYQEHQRFPRLVVTTFTRKATEEVRERLVKKAIELKTEKKNDLLLKFTSASGYLHISTIHGILASFLQRYGFLEGLDPRFQLISDESAQKMRKDLARNLITQSSDFRELVEYYGLSRLLSLFQSHYECLSERPEARGLSLPEMQTYKEKFLGELHRELSELEVALQREPSSNKPTKFIEQIEGLLKLRTYLGGNIDEGGALFEELPTRLGNTSKYSAGISELRRSVFEKMKLYFFNPFFAEGKVEEWSRWHESFARAALEFQSALEDKKLSSQQLEMSDLEYLALRVLSKYPEEASAFSGEWDFWFIDEYQDTSPIQVRLLEKLIGATPHYCVGDPQQSIYLFRGARSKVFLEKKAQVQNSLGQYRRKVDNYRSSSSVLEFINDLVIQVNPTQFTRMESKSAELNFEPSAEFILCENRDQELLAIFERIIELHLAGASFGDIAVLCKRNDDLQIILKKAKELGVPVQLETGGRYFENAEIRDALLLLKFLLNPHDNLNYLSLVRSPWFRIDDRVLFSKKWQQGSYWLQSTLDLKTEAAVICLQKYMEQVNQVGISEVFLAALQTEGLFSSSRSIDPSGRREANLWKLVGLIKSQERNGSFNFLELLTHHLSSTEENRESEAVAVADPNRVQLLTVHGSKGLEFSHVILPFIGDNPPALRGSAFRLDEDHGVWTLPLIKEDDQSLLHNFCGDRVLEKTKEQSQLEDQRLFYVAVTRAEQSLSFIYSYEKKVKEDSPSWRDQIHGFDLLNEGLHSSPSQKYKYRTRRGPLFEELPRLKDTVKAGGVRTAWREVSQSQVQKSSVTDLVKFNFKKTPESFLGSLIKANRGVEIHRYFERLKFDTKLSGAPEEIIKAIEYLRKQAQFPFDQVLKNGFVEWGFSLRKEKIELQGQIDLWGIDDSGGVWVVDYKSGSPEFLDSALSQLQIYYSVLLAMNRFKPETPANLVVIYPMTEKIEVRPAQALSLSEILLETN